MPSAQLGQAVSKSLMVQFYVDNTRAIDERFIGLTAAVLSAFDRQMVSKCFDFYDIRLLSSLMECRNLLAI